MVACKAAAACGVLFSQHVQCCGMLLEAVRVRWYVASLMCKLLLAIPADGTDSLPQA